MGAHNTNNGGNAGDGCIVSIVCIVAQCSHWLPLLRNDHHGIAIVARQCMAMRTTTRGVPTIFLCFAMGIDAMHCPHCLHHPDCPRWFSLRVPLVGAQTIIAEPWVAMPAIPCIAVRCFLRQHAIVGRCTGVDTCRGRCRSAHGGYKNRTATHCCNSPEYSNNVAH